jgi:hypothetical protein
MDIMATISVHTFFTGRIINKEMTFPATIAKPCTDEDFKAMTDESHHQGLTPLSVLPVGLSVCLRVVQKLLTFWLCGALHSSADGTSWLSAFSVHTLSDKLVKLARFIPQEFACQPRAVSEVDR